MATIKIDLDRKIGCIDRRIYGGFIEHLGRCVYGGIYEEGSSLSDAQGFRQDVLEAVRSLRPSVLRWPGGNFVSGYHWVDGVGPLERRPRRLDLAWHAEESNRFGTDEFIAYCRLVDAEPYLCINMDTGSMEEAQAWVEYCNGTGNTYWASLRRQNGHEEPYKVKYWGLGKEMYGYWQIGATDAETYVRKAREFAKVMKWTDPSIELISCGYSGLEEWDRIVLEGLAPYIRYHSIHLYTGSHDYYSNVFSVHQVERMLSHTQALIDLVRYTQRIEHPINVAFDEWNVWFRKKDEDQGLEELYTLADALAVATYLNIFTRFCNTVSIANQAQLVNAIAPIFTDKEGLFLQTIYHPLRLYNVHMHEIALDAYVECETYTLLPEAEVANRHYRVASLRPFPFLDVAVTCSKSEREITIAVVNRDQKHEHYASIQLQNAVEVNCVVAYEVNASDLEAGNSFAQPAVVGVEEHYLDPCEQSFNYTFPAHSLTLLCLRLEQL
ncbi:MAG: alpha-N-arabinofuranosidase [Ktedonobacteraceae bacterium]